MSYAAPPVANASHSRQIRPPIYSLKQSKLRKRRVIRFAMLYFTMFIIFLLMIVGPIVASKFMSNDFSGIPMNLLQPTGQNNNDTSSERTGSALNGLSANTAGGGAAATSA